MKHYNGKIAYTPCKAHDNANGQAIKRIFNSIVPFQYFEIQASALAHQFVIKTDARLFEYPVISLEIIE